ncbi:HAUS augmin-like complex subunit 4 [Mytilus galloprovincialis]|uniref:HAUS augmin-like complex subunit 4 n=1 Tax=Mytilus galloprovincialis TaxID=29158 RepID=UPI003F7C94DD
MLQCDKVNESLPVNVTDEVIQQNPEFSRLLNLLSQHINSDGTSVQAQKDLQQAEEELKHEKHNWLMQKTIYREVEELLMDYEIKSQECSLSSEDKQFQAALQECLTMAEIGDYVDCNPEPGSSSTLLGLTREEIQRQNPYKKHLPFLQQKLLPDIEDRLRLKCESLVTFHDPDNGTESDRLTFAKASQLPAMIDSECHELKQMKVKLNKEKHRKDKQFWLYYQTLLDSLSLLEDLICRYRLQNQTEHDTVTTEWLVSKCDGLCLKIRLTELQILCETYTVETCRALSQIRKYLKSEHDETETEYTNVSQALKAYESVGMGFDSLVNEYSKLKNEVENKQWALKEFQQSIGNKDR